MAVSIAKWRAVYYPYLQLRNSTWLKVAALYYDQLDRIVPPGVVPEDNRTVKALNEHFGFVNNIDPGKAAKDVMPDFLRFVLQRLKREEDRQELMQLLENQFDFEQTFQILRGKVGNQLVVELKWYSTFIEDLLKGKFIL